jgi:hypothetical protein
MMPGIYKKQRRQNLEKSTNLKKNRKSENLDFPVHFLVSVAFSLFLEVIVVFWTTLRPRVADLVSICHVHHHTVPPRSSVWPTRCRPTLSCLYNDDSPSGQASTQGGLGGLEMAFKTT